MEGRKERGLGRHASGFKQYDAGCNPVRPHMGAAETLSSQSPTTMYLFKRACILLHTDPHACACALLTYA